MRDLVRALGFLGVMVGAVAIVTFGLAAGLAPAPISAEPTATPQPTFDLAVAPNAIGGRLEVHGDRSGTLVLDEVFGGLGPRYQPMEGGGVTVLPAEVGVVLGGPEGRIIFERGAAVVTQIDFEELSFYLDPDECDITHGAVNRANELMAALVECHDIADIRDNGTVSITGVVALPAPVLRGRGDLPPSGGTVVLGEAEMTFEEVEIFLDGAPNEETGRVSWGMFDEDFVYGLHLEYDPGAGQYYLDAWNLDDEYAELPEPCPIESTELGRLDDYTTVKRLDIECRAVPVPGGGTGSVTGSVVADVIQGLMETLSEP